jgi:VanZ family protein
MEAGGSGRKPWRWLAWWLGLAIWTVALLTPHPNQVGGRRFLPPEVAFVVAKTLHVSVYALLAALVGWLPARPMGRGLLIALLFLHAGATEYGQLFVPGRTGTLRDVGLDSMGVVLGLALSWGLRRTWRGRGSP